MTTTTLFDDSSSFSQKLPIPPDPSSSLDQLYSHCADNPSPMDMVRCWMTILRHSFRKKPARQVNEAKNQSHDENQSLLPPAKNIVQDISTHYHEDEDTSRAPHNSRPRPWLRQSFSSDASVNSYHGTTNTRALRQSLRRRDSSSSTSSSTLTVIPTCPAGEYWMEHEVDNDDGFGSSSTSIVGECQAVGAGYYSPKENGQRYPCPVGTFSDVEWADTCQECLPFYYNGLGSDYAVALTPDINGAPMNGLFCLQPNLSSSDFDSNDNDTRFPFEPEDGIVWTPTASPSSGTPTTMTPTVYPMYNYDYSNESPTMAPTWTASSLYPTSESPTGGASNIAPNTMSTCNNNGFGNNHRKRVFFFSTPGRNVLLPLLVFAMVMVLVWFVFSKPLLRSFCHDLLCRPRRCSCCHRSLGSSKKKKKNTKRNKTVSPTVPQAWRSRCHRKTPPTTPSSSISPTAHPFSCFSLSASSSSMSRAGSCDSVSQPQSSPPLDSFDSTTLARPTEMGSTARLAHYHRRCYANDEDDDDDDEMEIQFESNLHHVHSHRNIDGEEEYYDEAEYYDDEEEEDYDDFFYKTYRSTGMGVKFGDDDDEEDEEISLAPSLSGLMSVWSVRTAISPALGRPDPCPAPSEEPRVNEDDDELHNVDLCDDHSI